MNSYWLWDVIDDDETEGLVLGEGTHTNGWFMEEYPEERYCSLWKVYTVSAGKETFIGDYHFTKDAVTAGHEAYMKLVEPQRNT